MVLDDARDGTMHVDRQALPRLGVAAALMAISRAASDGSTPRRRARAAFDMVVSYHTRTPRPNLPCGILTSALAWLKPSIAWLSPHRGARRRIT